MYTYLRILSLDVVLGAVASGGMVAHLQQVDMPWIWWVALPLSVWVIYTADHLLDAYRLGATASTLRHQFHHRHLRPLGGVWAIGLGSCLTWIPWMAPAELLWFGIGMGGLVGLHLSLVYLIGDRISLLFVKEVGVGTIYAAGVWGGPLVLFPPAEWLPWIMLFVQFWSLAMINLLAFSLYEWETDERDGHTSFVRAIGRVRTRQLMGAIGIGIIALGFGLGATDPPFDWIRVELVFALMLGLLWAVAFWEKGFVLNERYRVWGDAAFLLPGLVWVWG